MLKSGAWFLPLRYSISEFVGIELGDEHLAAW